MAMAQAKPQVLCDVDDAMMMMTVLMMKMMTTMLMRKMLMMVMIQECWNPTEGGGYKDGTGLTSSSILENIRYIIWSGVFGVKS